MKTHNNMLMYQIKPKALQKIKEGKVVYKCL